MRTGGISKHGRKMRRSKHDKRVVGGSERRNGKIWDERMRVLEDSRLGCKKCVFDFVEKAQDAFMMECNR